MGLREPRLLRGGPRLTTHRGWATTILAGVVALAILLAVATAGSAYRSSTDLHVATELVGSLIGFVAGYALLARFLAGGRRVELLLGLAFFVNAAADVAHGLLPLSVSQGWIQVAAADAERFTPATYATGRLLMAVTLLVAIASARELGVAARPRREARIASAASVAISVLATVLVFTFDVPTLRADADVFTRPLDLVSSLAFLAAAWLLLSRPRLQLGAQPWLAASALVAAVGETVISTSTDLFDAGFDIGHLAKVLAYALPVVGFIRDQVQVIAREQQTIVELRRTDEARTAFLGSVTHELRTPLAAIHGFATLLAADPEPRHGLRRDIAERIRRNATSLHALVEDILLFSRMEGERLELTPEPCDLDEVVREVVDRLGPLLGDHHVELDLPSVAATVDARAFEQIVVNLVTNASYYTPKGSRIRVSLATHRSTARLLVEDDGPGVDPDEREAILERFHRGRQGLNSSRPGTGLGLSLVTEVVQAMDGWMDVGESHDLGGASFLVALPLAPATATPAPVPH